MTEEQNKVIVKYALALPVLFILFSCINDKNNVSGGENIHDLNTEIKQRDIQERKINLYNIRKTDSIQKSKKYFLRNPQSFEIDSEGERIYIFDYGDMKVKEFDLDGIYIGSYGKGMGSGPGKVSNISDAGPIGDSAVYIADQRNRRVTFFDKKGNMKESLSYENISPSRYKKDNYGTDYVTGLGLNGTFVLASRANKKQRFDKFHNASPILSDGNVESYENKIIYIPSYYPVLIEYNIEDTTGTAYPTPDYGKEEAPSANVKESGSGKRVSAPPTSERVHYSTALINDTLSVQIPCPNTDVKKNVCFDLYNPKDLSYIKSVRIPIDRGSANYWDKTVVSEQDTIVYVRKVYEKKKSNE